MTHDLRRGLMSAAFLAPLLVVVTVGVTPASASPTSPSAPGQVAAQGQQVTQFSALAAAPVWGADRVASDLKAAKAEAAYAQTIRAVSPGQVTPMFTNFQLTVPYQQQVNETYCGPATMAMIVAYAGHGFSGNATQQQNSAASMLGTGSGGTDWYNGSRYPMQYALNARIGTSWYSPTTVSGTPTAAQKTAYANALVYDITRYWAFAGDQDSIPNYNIGYQPNGYWQHWWAASGYNTNGAITYFDDPAQWSAYRLSNAYSTYNPGTTNHNYHTVISAIGGRGYIW